MAAGSTSRVPRVLVVEDESLIGEEIVERVTRMGLQVAGVVHSGEAAVETAARESPELVLMDIRLKGKMDGIEAAAAIRRVSNIPVVYLTAHSDKTTRARAMETTPCGYVLKPFREEDLVVAIETAIHLNLQERRLKDSELRYAATLASIADGVVATDENGCVTFMNSHAETLSGWKFVEASGRPIEEVLQFVEESSGAPLEHPVRGALRLRISAAPTAGTLLLRRDGLSIPVGAKASPITSAAGIMIGAVAAFRDLRASRVMEETLRKVEQQLRQSQKSDAIGRLAGGVAHDFNNLLTVINGCAEMALSQEEISDSTKDLLTDIASAGQRAGVLTNQLLSFSRKQVLAPVVLNLNLVVQGMENMIRRIVREDISLEFSLDPAIGSVRADQSQFEQVIMNLVVNAREAIASGGRLTMETFNSDVEDPDFARLSGIKLGRYVVLAVTDTGVGMNEATKAHMFEPFFTTKKFLKGTGLGLATVHGIVAQSGGGIAIETAPGQGSKFSIYLPRIAERVAERVAEPVAERVADNSPHAKASHFSETLPGRETILLVEDEDRVLLVLAGMLRSYGYRVLPAHGGQEALEICRSQSEPIHLLLTDAVLPQMGGVEIAKAVQALLPNLPVLYLSGYVDDAVLLSHLGRTGSDVLEKPVTATVLAAKVRQTLDSYAKAHPRSMMRANDHTRTGAGDSA